MSLFKDRSGGLYNRLRSRNTWTRGNDIYAVRGSDVRGNDEEGKMDHRDVNIGVTRSGYYHSYWRGWTEVRVDRPGKRFKIERVYTAPWIRQDLSDRAYVLYRLLYAFLTALAIALFAFSMTRPVGSNYCWYVALFGLPATIIMLIVFFSLIGYIKAKRKMTLYEHKVSSTRLKRVMVVFSALLAATGLATIVYLFLNRDDAPLLQLRGAVLDLLAAGSVFSVYYMEKHMKYVDVPNPTKPPEGGKTIW